MFIFWTGLVIYHPTNAQDSFIQVNVGYGVLSSINLGISVDIEKKYASHDYFTLSLGYSYDDVKSRGATYNGVTYPLKIEARNFSLATNWYPIKIKKQPISLLYIKLGLAWYQISYNKETNHNYGPGIQYGLGIQYLFFGKLAIGVRSESAFYYNFGDWFEGFGSGFLNLNLSVGYRFQVNPKTRQ